MASTATNIPTPKTRPQGQVAQPKRGVGRPPKAANVIPIKPAKKWAKGKQASRPATLSASTIVELARETTVKGWIAMKDVLANVKI